LLGVYVVWSIYSGKIDLKYVIGDKDGDAAWAAFKSCLTFVVARPFLLRDSPEAAGFPENPASVLTLLGISGSAFLVSRG